MTYSRADNAELNVPGSAPTEARRGAAASRAGRQQLPPAPLRLVLVLNSHLLLWRPPSRWAAPGNLRGGRRSTSGRPRSMRTALGHLSSGRRGTSGRSTSTRTALGHLRVALGAELHVSLPPLQPPLQELLCPWIVDRTLALSCGRVALPIAQIICRAIIAESPPGPGHGASSTCCEQLEQKCQTAQRAPHASTTLDTYNMIIHHTCKRIRLGLVPGGVQRAH